MENNQEIEKELINAIAVEELKRLKKKETLKKITNIVDAINKVQNRISIIIVIIVLSILSYELINRYFDITILYNHIIERIAKPKGIWTTVGFVFLIGILLSVFKLKQQFWYGIFETVFAIVSCYFAVKSIKPSSDVLSIMIAFGSTIYLIVRGLSNILDGTKKPFWIKNEILTISENASTVTSESLTTLLKDKEAFVNAISIVLNSFNSFF